MRAEVDRRSRVYLSGQPGHLARMCRNIRVLYNFQPPTTEEEIRAAALQYVRKVSGLRAPSLADRAAFDLAVDDVAAVTGRLLGVLEARAPVRTRDGEREKLRARWKLRQAR
jgi:hypothetical protein